MIIILKEVTTNTKMALLDFLWHSRIQKKNRGNGVAGIADINCAQQTQLRSLLCKEILAATWGGSNCVIIVHVQYSELIEPDVTYCKNLLFSNAPEDNIIRTRIDKITLSRYI